MSADRILTVSPEAAAERRRAASLVTTLADSVLASVTDVTHGSPEEWLLKRFCWELTVLASHVRDGGTPGELERVLASKVNVLPQAQAQQGKREG